LIRKQIGPVACFQNVIVVDKLPKTRSGKILRNILRKIIEGEEYKFPATI
jgi:propionyl-CoA synthetase